MVKLSSFFVAASSASLLAVVFLPAVTVAQAAQNPPGTMQMPGMSGPPQEAAQAGMGHEQNYPKPTNLKVLPKHLTGAEVRDIMHHWAGDLGVGCDHCHAAYPNRIGPDGRPLLNFASDAKTDKKMARMMYTMLQMDKKNYVAKVAAMDTMTPAAALLTCGTCHRGDLDPKAYVPPPRKEHGPHPMGAPPAGGHAAQGN